MFQPKKFFNKIKLDRFFKKVGPGHRLDDEGSNQGTSFPRPGGSSSPRTESEEARRAAEAAIARFQQDKRGVCHATMRTNLRSEIEADVRSSEQNKTERSASPKRENPQSSSVLFKCPDIGPAVLPKQEMNDYIREFLFNQLAEEPGMASALMIQTLNKNRDSVKICVDILIKYIDNLLKNPNEEKFRRIRVNNKAFKDKVYPVEGSEEYLQSCGFERKSLPFEDSEEMFLVIPIESASDPEHLEMMKSFLQSAEPIRPQLDRALRVYHPSRVVPNFVVPDEFYNLTPGELKKEQQMRTETAENLGILRTKAMRERDEQRELRRYRYTLIRIRFPNGVLLEGTFKATEKLSALFAFVSENLLYDWLPFILVTSIGQKLVEQESTFAELGLAPSAIVNFTLEEDMASDLSAQQSNLNKNGPFLKPEIECLMQELR